jgi:hypothetical protein
MDLHRTTYRATAVLLAGALATTLLAPAAEAGRRSHRRGHRPATVVVERRSDAGAVFGFLGGLVLGTVIANAQAEAAPPVCACARGTGYDYHDPWCGLTFGSLAGYEGHLDRHRHPRTAEVVDACTGRVVDTVRWCDGGWIGGDGDCAAAPRCEGWED